MQFIYPYAHLQTLKCTFQINFFPRITILISVAYSHENAQQLVHICQIWTPFAHLLCMCAAKGTKIDCDCERENCMDAQFAFSMFGRLENLIVPRVRTPGEGSTSGWCSPAGTPNGCHQVHYNFVPATFPPGPSFSPRASIRYSRRSLSMSRRKW